MSDFHIAIPEKLSNFGQIESSTLYLSKMNVQIIKRQQQEELERVHKIYSVIVVTGPRQSGKTTLCKTVFKDYHYVNLEDISLRTMIMASPKAFLQQYTEGLILDEVQNAPELLSYIQVIVDEVANAKFILTGSSDFKLMASVSQSLAGRSAVLSLLPLSLRELGEEVYKKETDELILNGGYPAVWGRNIPVQDLSRNYYNTYIERDVRQLLKVKDLNSFQTFIRLCAGRIGSEFNAASLSNEVGVSAPTIKEWLSVLEASYIIFRLPPFFRNIGKRLVKTPKLYFCDTALACFLLGIENETQLATHPLRGNLFENMLVLEFLKNRFNQGKNSNLYFYKDKTQNEVDLIEEFGTEIKAYEIKSAKAFTKSFTKGLDYLGKIIGESLISSQVIYDGEYDLPAKKNGIVNFRNLKL